MHFINKLIKRGIFGLIVVFSFFVFGNSVSVSAATCTIKLNDGNDYLVVNQGLGWTDSGVTLICDGSVNKNVTVQINSGTPVSTTNSGVGVAKSLNAGFYRIKYYMTGDESVMVTRQIRVLTNSLNDRVNFWLGDSENVSTSANDAFNRVVSVGVENVGYLAAGNFGQEVYLVAYNLRGEYLWHASFGAGTYSGGLEVEAIRVNDIISAGEDNTSYYIAGEYDTALGTGAFIRKIVVNSDGSGVADVSKTFYSVADEMTSITKIVLAGNYVVASGYKANVYGTRSGVIGRFQIDGGAFASPTYFKKSVESEFNSVFAFTENSALKIVAVGSTEVSGYLGAQGGSVVKCDVLDFECGEQTPYYYLNDNKATTTITSFNDVVSHGTGYVVVGQSRIDKVVGSSTSTNAGVEDSIIVSMDLNFKVLDVKLIGAGNQDNLLTINSLDDSGERYVVVGCRGASGEYVSLNIKSGKIEVKEQVFSGSGTVLNDVIVNVFADEEIQYVFVGSTGASSIDSISFVNKGEKDTLFALIDDTNYSNFGDITVYQNAVICNDGVSKSCSVENLDETYHLGYGTLKVPFSKGNETEVIISTESVRTHGLYHSFKNAQGVVIMVGRKMHVKQSIEASDLNTSYLGIDKWYLYSREAETNGDGVREETWEEYYYPVEDHVKKEDGVTYYKFSAADLSFVVDNSGLEETSENYIMLAQEPTKEKVAFQSYENAVKFSLVQEFSRIALVNAGYYNYGKDNGVLCFDSETISLRRQNYYFVYYPDMSFVTDKEKCESINGKLYGDCTNYAGYAFTKLSTIKKLIENIINDNEYFVSKQSNRFKPFTGTDTPVSGQFNMEEVYTVEYVKEKTIKLEEGLTLEIKYYRPSGDSINGYNGFDLIPEITSISGQNEVRFSTVKSTPDFTYDGKYEVRKCYNYKGDDNSSDQVCGTPAVFVIDTTVPVVNFSFLGGGEGQMNSSTEEGKVDVQKMSITVTSIRDIDDYAYTIYNGEKYFLKCSAKINSAMCLADLQISIRKVFDYDPTNPDKIFTLQVYDRAGNTLDVRFKVGTANPLINVVDDDTMDDSFVLDIDFYNKNEIRRVEVDYIPSETSEYSAVEGELTEAITDYIKAVYHHNREELNKYLNGEIENPRYITELWNLANGCDPLDVGDSCKLLTFNRTSDVEGDSENGYVINNGLAVPVFDYSKDGKKILKRNGTNSGYEYEYLSISKGLYRITIIDSFDNFAEDCGGIGLGKAELYTYVEKDDDYEEFVEIDGEKVNIYEALERDYLAYKDYIKTPTEDSDNVASHQFFATSPSSYAYFETLPVSLHSAFDETMAFTNQFIYVKFAVSSFGGFTINKANGLNKVGSYVDGSTKYLDCIFAFYGDGVPPTLEGIPSCTNRFTFSNIESNDVKEALANEGIYFVDKLTGIGSDGSEKLYYYLAFTEDGTYEVSTDINPNFEGISFEHVSVPAKYSFTIDSIKPNVDFSVVCEAGKTCKGDKNSYIDKSDFVFESGSKVITNIGNHDMKLIVNNDLITYTDALGQLATVENRLLVIKIGEDIFNAYEYALKNSDPIDGNYILFSNTGTYEIMFFDAGGNQIVYRFIIDKSSPEVDHNGSNFSGFQTHVDIAISIVEDSALTLVSKVSLNDIEEDAYVSYSDVDACLLDMACVLYKLYVDNDAKFNERYAFYSFVDGGYILLGNEDEIDPTATYYYDSKENILNIDFWKSVDDVKTSVGIVKTAEGKCYIATGSGSIKEGHSCIVVDEGGREKISVTFEVSIEPMADIQTFTLKVADYFGNGYTVSQSFYFDNLSPYIAFSGYTPTTYFGNGNDEIGNSIFDTYKSMWLSASSGATSTTFSCNGDVLGKGNIIKCSDTPEIDGKENGVIIHAFEAERMAYNNYEISDNSEFVAVENGKIVDAQVKLYREEFSAFVSASDLERAQSNGTKIYVFGNKYVLMESYDYIEPSKTYYFDDEGSKTSVSISDMYTNPDDYSAYTSLGECGDDYKCALYRLYVESGKFTDLTYKFYLLEENTMVEFTQAITNFTNYSNYYFVSDYVSDDGKYLPALTRDNSCVVIDQSGSTFTCIPVVEGRAKMNDDTHVYYNVVSKAVNGVTNVQNLSVGGENKSGVIDETVWQIAMNGGKEVKFGFGIESNFGRPIIFRAVDGAGNIGSNHVETVVRLEDKVNPVAVEIAAISYVRDEEAGKTKDNYILGTAYYKVPKGGECILNKYYTYSGGVYSLDDCSEWNPNTRHYIAVENSYIKIEDGQNKDFGVHTYYKRVESSTSKWDGFFLTDKDIVITFSETINKVECSYYLKNVATGEIIEDSCSYNNTEYDYREDKRSFEFVFEDVNLDNYYINYSIKVYDISGNSSSVVKTLYVDRDIPTISLRDQATEELPVDYISQDPVTKYNESYLDGGYKSSINYIDEINIKMGGQGTSVQNPENYEVSYKKFNFNKTYMNYVKDGNGFTKIGDGANKVAGTTYYILIEDTGDYVLKGNSGECKDGYCYIEDDRNYYPSLLLNEDYWLPVTKITNDKISVYRIEYQAFDQYGRASNKVYKTIYITDTRAPDMKVNGVSSGANTGEHYEVTISFENEKEAVWYRYMCSEEDSEGNTCSLPGSIFAQGNNLNMSVSDIVGTTSFEFKNPGVYKLYFHDSGNYISSNVKSIVNVDGDYVIEYEEVKTLKYNYREYTFRIDKTPPVFSITAKGEANNNMYYEVVLLGDEKLFCMIDGRMSTINNFVEGSLCQNTMSAYKTSIKEEMENVIYYGYNANDELIYEVIYEKIGTGMKYFYYSYYYRKDGGSFAKYEIGDPALNDIYNDNVYRIKSTKLVFRQDGLYAVRAKDNAGNIAARTEEDERGHDIIVGTYSTFIIDNTAPTYNKNQINPTGVNLWYSVPSSVINKDNQHYIQAIGSPTNGQYNISSSLNDSFFYAFATQRAAEEYLIGIYTEHINAQENTACASGVGFNYNYFDPVTKTMVYNKCFVDSQNVSHKSAAISAMITMVKDLVYKTFSGDYLFGDTYIKQKVCDESKSYCKSEVYKYVYLKKDYTENASNTSIEEVCTPVPNETVCIKINLQIVKSGSKISYYLGNDNSVDRDSSYMYKYTTNPTSSRYEISDSSEFNIELSSGAYYVFEERDEEIKYTNSDRTTYSHYNRTYYGIYVDKSDNIAVYYRDDEINGTKNLITSDNSGGILTNHNTFNLIIKREGETLKDFLERYEILETRDEQNKLLEVYSYLRVKVIIEKMNSSEKFIYYYNINDYIEGYDKNGILRDDYYFEIPIINTLTDMKDRIVNVYFVDRVGNSTDVTISHSQTDPSIKVAYSGEGKNQTVRLEVSDNKITTVYPHDIKVYFSPNRSGYSMEDTENILSSLICRSGTTGYLYGCINAGTINSINSYAVNISNLEGLIGFFKVYAIDDHGNDFELEFVYNPADMDARYTSMFSYITSETEGGAMGEKRAITRQNIGLEWNNEINYIILYKHVDGQKIEVCNSKTYGTGKHLCGNGSNENNYVDAVWVDSVYSKSIINFVDEGLYSAEIINRHSIVINLVCIENGEVIDGCKEIKTETNNGCDWDTNKNRCIEGYNIKVDDVVIVRSVGGGSDLYYFAEVDKTPPSYDAEKDFIVTLPSGNIAFTNNGEYTNASVNIYWYEPGVTVHYSCSYLDKDNSSCLPGSMMYGAATKETNADGVRVAKLTLGANIRQSAKYTVYYTDFVGNSTIDTPIEFTIVVKLPEVQIFEVQKKDDTNPKLLDTSSGKKPKIRNDVQLVCYLDGELLDNCDYYYVELYKDGVPVPFTDYIVSENEEVHTYEYIAYIKSSTNQIFNRNLKVSSGVVEIDKESPNIGISGDKNKDYGFYKGEVTVTVTGGTATVYGNCVAVEDNGNKVYACDDEPYMDSFDGSAVVNKTGTYRVVAIDDIGNITTGSKIKYFTIDNDKPTISVDALTEHTESGYTLPEGGFTNASKIVVKAIDNNEGVKINYCLKTGEENCQWVEVVGGEIIFTDEGIYKVKAVDAVGNQSFEKSFKVYRQKPTYTLKYVKSGKKIEDDEINKIFEEDIVLTWLTTPVNEFTAPIVKVTMNGVSYKNSSTISGTGEYAFMLVDLAGNVSTFKISINKNDKVCLDGVCIKPNAEYHLAVKDVLSFSANYTYKFKKNDVFIFATPTNAYGNSSECMYGIFNYKSLLDKKSYYIISESKANAVNKAPFANPQKLIRLTKEEQALINELGGYVYIFVVDYDVAKNLLGFQIGESFFVHDPLGWSLIFIAGIGVLYVGFKLVFLRKRVRVLK